MKRQLLKRTLGLGLLLAMSVVTIYAADNYKGYWGYSLPPRRGNNYTTQHEKQYNDNYINNTVVSLKNASTVTFWAADSDKDQISNDYNQKAGSTAKIKFTEKGFNKAGKEVMLGMENASWYWREYAFADGKVDFR